MASLKKCERVLVTGANGFVGMSLSVALVAKGLSVRLAARNEQICSEVDRRLAKIVHRCCYDTNVVEVTPVGDLGTDIEWRPTLQGIDTVVHLAGRAHVLKERTSDPMAIFRAVNVAGTKRLAECAVETGVRRLIYISSIKVNGEQTRGRPYDEHDSPQPEDEYGISKWEAEQALWGVVMQSSMEAVVLRPPLLYGPGVKGNFYALMHAIARGVPLPIASVNNRRSLLNVRNLVDAILLCLDRNAAIGKTYLLADDEDVSSPDLARRIGDALGRQARLFSCPPGLLKFAGASMGRSAAVSRLLGSLQVNSKKIRDELGWRPSTGIRQGLSETAHWFYNQSSQSSSL